jgi:hypothetical protein
MSHIETHEETLKNGLSYSPLALEPNTVFELHYSPDPETKIVNLTLRVISKTVRDAKKHGD